MSINRRSNADRPKPGLVRVGAGGGRVQSGCALGSRCGVRNADALISPSFSVAKTFCTFEGICLTTLTTEPADQLLQLADHQAEYFTAQQARALGYGYRRSTITRSAATGSGSVTASPA